MRHKVPAFIVLILILIGVAYSNSFLTPFHYDDILSISLVVNELLNAVKLTGRNANQRLLSLTTLYERFYWGTSCYVSKVLEER